ncbi:unnamed protein product, partial [Porites evermanni]
IFRIFKGTCVKEIRRWFQENVAVPSVNFFLQLCRHSHVKCNHCVPDLSGSSVRSGYPIPTATSTENLSVPVTSQETV